MLKYIELKQATKNANKLKIEVYYNLGHFNYFTGKEEKRGYYLSVTPVFNNGFIESYTSFTGIKQLILPVNRKSGKARANAITEAEKHINTLINYVCTKNNIEV